MKSLIHRGRDASRSGFTLLEAIISMAVVATLMVSVLSIATDMTIFSRNADAHSGIQADADQAFGRLAEILRKSGWSDLAGTTYPRVLAGGAQLQFRILADADGNGFNFDAVTGELEWSTQIYRVARDPSSNTLYVYAPDGTRVWHLARHVTLVDFATYLQDSTLNINEVSVTIATEREDARGQPIGFETAGSIHMRN